MATDKANKKNKNAKSGSAGTPEAAAAASGLPEQAADAAATPVETPVETAGAEADATEATVDAADAGTAEEAVEVLDEIIADVAAEAEEVIELSDEDAAILDAAATDLVAEMRSDMLRAQAELVNFRTRVERDRVANREAVIAEVIRSMLPALDDLSRAEKHGDLAGSPLEIVATKIRGSFERYGLRSVGVNGELFDPHFHEAVVQLPTPGATDQTVADVIEPGYALGERLIRAAKVAVSVPE
jgi:molecular chaperone GrpE